MSFNYVKFTQKEYQLIEEYQKDNSSFLCYATIEQKNGKKRHIVTYSNKEQGKSLRKVHKKIANYLQNFFKQDKHSYAYKKDSNCAICVQQHNKGKMFLKLDIHSFFESITLDEFCKQMVINLCKVNEKEYEEIMDNTTSIYNFLDETMYRYLRKMLACCFVKEKLTIGFITSPKISDIYLSFLDKKYGRNKKVTYTRYCDDILFSLQKEKYFEQLEELEKQIHVDFFKLHLSLNVAKRKSITLNQDNYLHFLGVNILKGKKKNRFTISTSYIRETILLYKDNHFQLNDSIRSRVSYIRYMSEESYQKFLISFQAMCHRNYLDILH